MTYFADFPKIVYQFGTGTDNQFQVILTDITQNVRFRAEVLSQITLFDNYTMVEGDTPERVAEKFYGNANYHWVVMLANERFNPYTDFPLTQLQLDAYVTQVYGAGHENDIHHYSDGNGNTVNSDFPSATPITNAEYEDSVNEGKRQIKIISPTLLPQLLETFKSLI